jgi:hypothetical protein
VQQDGNQARLPDLPEPMQNFAGYPRYEALLLKDCPAIGRPCIRERCKKWSQVVMKMPNRLAPTQSEDFILFQCQDDTIHAAVVQTSNIMAQSMNAAMAQQANQMMRGHRPGGQLPPGFPGSG